MLYGNLIAATVITFSLYQGHPSIACFSVLTSASHGSSAIAELLVKMADVAILYFKLQIFL